MHCVYPPYIDGSIRTLADTDNTPIHLPLIQQGKVRDIYAVDDNHMLIVASDRLSAFDVILPDPIPGKGEVLTAVSLFWFHYFKSLTANHLTDMTLADAVPDPSARGAIANRAMVVKRLRPLPVEAVARGYLAGSGWKEYRQNGTVCGVELPDGLQQASRLPEPIFTPATKAAAGDHDENINFTQLVETIGKERACEVRELTLAIYTRAAEYARTRGIIIADTKLEFGLDEQDRLHLIDEVLTPDSSRFWPADAYRTGISPPSFDKQFVRDYLESLDWDKTPPGPRLPEDILQRTTEKYREAQRRLTGQPAPETA